MTPDERDDQKTTTTSGRSGFRQGADYGVEAGKQYDGGVLRFVRSGRVEPAAQEARRSVEGPEGPSLHDAEERTARRGAMPGDPVWLGHVRAAAHHAVDRVLSSVAHAEEWLKAHSAKSSYHGDGRPASRR